MKFRGHSLRSLDPKGRLMLPPEFRERIAEESSEGKAVLTILDDCVVGFTDSEWACVESEMAKIKNPSKQLRNFKRKFISGSETVQIDKQGRISVPAHLREYGKLDKEIVVAGVGSYFEIWNKEEFDELLKQQDIDEVSEELSASGVNLPF